MKERHYLFTSESVSIGHPDKVADRISDAILDAHLAQDQFSRVACETLVTRGLVVVSGEITSKAVVDIDNVVRNAIKECGYDSPEYMFDYKSCGIINSIHKQSPDISQGIDLDDEHIGAGDQGIMFGYACDETSNYMPLPISLANDILIMLTQTRMFGDAGHILGPDAKSQVTVEYDRDNNPVKIDTIVISQQHKDGIPPHLLLNIINEVLGALCSKYPILNEGVEHLYINPTGKFVIGGPAGDTGLTGRKIIVDTYGGICQNGGGAFSGKDPTKVDRSAAYAARYFAKNIVAAGLCKRCTVQVSYAIGIPEPISVMVNTHGTEIEGVEPTEIYDKLKGIFSFAPKAIIDRFQLRRPIYTTTSSYGHFGDDGYDWEMLNLVDEIKQIYNLK